MSSYTAGFGVSVASGGSLDAEGDHRRAALRHIVGEGAPAWTEGQQRDAAAAALDVAWSLPA